MRKSDGPGYVAISRTIFDHPEFKENRPLTRLEAWQWLIGKAAWKPRTQRFRHQSVRLDRGQMTASIRSIGQAWHWPKSNVARWLHRLAALDMLGLQKTGTAPGTVSGTARLVITICNYDKFNRTKKKVGQQVGQYPGQSPEQPLLLQEEFGVEPTNHLTIESRGGIQPQVASKTRAVNRTKPHHGAKGKGMIWFDLGTQEWKLYAEDFRNVRGADILPENRIGGLGNWFRWAGEATGRKRA